MPREHQVGSNAAKSPCTMSIVLAMMWACVWAWACVGAEGKEAGQLYSSLAHMETLFDFDEHLGELLPHLPEHLPAATRYLESYASLQMDRNYSREVRGHPLHVYQVLKRLVLFWPHIAPSLRIYTTLDERACQNLNEECDPWAMRGNCLHYREYMMKNCALACGTCLPSGLKERVMEVVTEANNTVMPSDDDLRGAAYALSRLQIHYRIPISSFMAGRIANTTCSARLTVEDCVRVAAATHHFRKYGDAWLWYDYCQASAFLNPRLRDEIRQRKNEVEEEHDMNFVPDCLAFLPLRLNETKSQKPLDSPFSKLCRGDNTEFQDNEESWRLRCHVNNRGSPYLTLQPVRYEQLHYDPEMYMFHDVVSDAEIEIIKDLATKKLERSLTVSDDSSSSTTEERVSHTAWLKNASHPVLERVARRITEVTQLFTFEDTNACQAGEKLQVLNYGIGGFYSAHYDVFYKNLPEEKWLNATNDHESGDRMATWIFYLSDVTAGGKTAFPEAGFAVSPVKGSAAFWFNIKKNGDFNRRTLHGGCPVLMGQKWVANRWIRENANFLRRPCSTNPRQ